MKQVYRGVLGVGFIFLAGCASCNLQVSVKCGDGQVTEFTCNDPGNNPGSQDNTFSDQCANALAQAQKACASSVPNKQF